MSCSYRTVRRVIFCLIAILLLLSGFPAMAQQQPIGHLMPMSRGHSDNTAGFAREGAANTRNNQVNVLVLPLAYSSQLDAIADAAAPTHTPTVLTATPTPTLIPQATSTALATSIPAAAPSGTSATGEMLPTMPIAIGAALLLFVIVLVAGRRRK